MAACRKVCLAHSCAHMHLVDVLWVLLYVWYLCDVYVKSNSNVPTKHKEYNYFDILVGGGEDLQFDQVSFLDYFVYRAWNAPMIFLFHCEKAIHVDTADCGLVFSIVDAPCAYVD